MPHACYAEVEAASHRELGEALGRKFGAIAREGVDYVRGEGGWKRKVAAAKDLLDRTRAVFPHYVEELEAYAAAAGVPVLHLWVLMVEDDLGPEHTDKCTTVVTNGGKLVSHNEDWDSDAQDAICVLKKALRGLTTLEIYYYNNVLGGTAITVNSNGYVQAINSLSPADIQPGVPRNVIARWLAETGDVEADVRKLAQMQRSSGYNHVFANTRGELFDLECSATRHVLTRPSSPYAHSNHFLCRELQQLDEGTQEDATIQRYRSACALMKDTMTLDEIVALNGDTSQGKHKSIMNARTIGKVIVDLDQRVARIWLRRERSAGWVDYPLDFVSGQPGA